MHSADDYQQQLNALLPPGPVWEALRSDPLMQGLLLAWADELARVDASNDSLLDEADPRTTVQLLTEWEAFASLPSACSPANQTQAQRQAALAQRLTGATAITRPSVVQMAADLGVSIAIVEHSAHRYGDRYGRTYGGTDWQLTWDVVYAGPQNALLECAISTVAPAGYLLRFVLM